jgi:protein-S-isoprenylcysteine O-methyltransferase Ste14
MTTLGTSILIAWAVFWAFWLLAATSAKKSTGRRTIRPAGLIVAVGVILARVTTGNTSLDLNVHSSALEAIGAVIFVAGLALALWARLYLGRNWGMPMSRKEEPELVTSGPYHFVRHPIYSGVLLAMLGTGLAVGWYWFIVFVALGVYFVYSATVEERIMSDTFPSAYPSYRAHTKMLIPFVL